jgi:hypothetical protein
MATKKMLLQDKAMATKKMLLQDKSERPDSKIHAPANHYSIYAPDIFVDVD